MAATVGGTDLLWHFPWACRVGEGARRYSSMRRRGLLLGAVHQALARRATTRSARPDRRILHDDSALVHPLRPSQPRLLPHLHHRTQFQALPHAGIPAHPTPLVLRPDLSCGSTSVVILGHRLVSLRTEQE